MIFRNVLQAADDDQRNELKFTEKEMNIGKSICKMVPKISHQIAPFTKSHLANMKLLFNILNQKNGFFKINII